MASNRRLISALIIAALIAVAAVVYFKRRAERAELKAGVDATRVINISFERTVQLGVLHVSGTMVTRTQSGGCFGLCASTQSTRAPFSVDYMVNLKGLPLSAYRWNSEGKVMFVEAPDVRALQPNIDMTKAQVEQGGMWISRDMGREMQARAASNLAGKAAAVAQSPENLTGAKEAARRGIAELVRTPLRAAGLGDVQVSVRLASDPHPADNQRWDVSRSIEDVLADPKFK